ncbi:MAG: RipA family octameric membrane protein [Planctomycetota bacterium]|jgi:hypothetical protein
MANYQREFLLEEYKTAWQTIMNIDERRAKFMKYYSFIFLGIMSVVLTHFQKLQDDVGLWGRIGMTSLLGCGVVVGVAVMMVLRSERDANIRYRKKVNLVREAFLKLMAPEDPADVNVIAKYLEHKDLGIKTFDGVHQPAGLGRTLKPVFFFIVVQICCLCAAGAYVWCVPEASVLRAGTPGSP